MGRLSRFAVFFLFFPFLFFSNTCFPSSSSEVLRELGKKYYLRGNYEQAVHELNKAVIADPADTVALAYLETAREKLRKKDMKSLLDYMETRREAPPYQPERVYAEETFQEPYVQESTPPEPVYEPTFKPHWEEERKIEKSPERKEKKVLFGDKVEVTGTCQMSLGLEGGEFLGKEADYNLNEEDPRILGRWGLNDAENTYDPAIFSQVRFNAQTINDEGWNFHSDIDISPWSFIGKSSKTTIVSNFGDTVDVELKYWSNSRHIVGETYYSNLLGDAFGIPEMKVINGRVLPFTTNGDFLWHVLSVPEIDIHREFWPLREISLDYSGDGFYFDFFPVALQDKAYTSDDPLGLSNHHIYWDESPWLYMWRYGHVNTGVFPNYYTDAFWDGSFSSITRDSSGTYLTNLRGLSFSLFSDNSDLDFTIASPKGLWQDYSDINSLVGALRGKYSLRDDLTIGGIYTFRLGYNEGEKVDASNHVFGFDVNYALSGRTKIAFEAAASSSDENTASIYNLDSRGNAFQLSVINSSRENIQDTDYYGIKPGKEGFFYKTKAAYTHMDSGFEAGLSDYRETRNDSLWSRHIHFKRPFDYYYFGIYGPSMGWEDVEPFAIGDGIDYGRDTVNLRFEWANLFDSRLDGLFDLRNVHSTDGDFIENVSRLDLTYRPIKRFTAKLLGIYHKLEHTVDNIDPFITHPVTGVVINPAMPDGEDPTLKTISTGFEYKLFRWLSTHFIWERTNDSAVAYGNSPRGILNDPYQTRIMDLETGRDYMVNMPLIWGQEVFPLPPYNYFDIFKVGMDFNVSDNLEVGLNWTRNEYEWAHAIDDNFNHFGFEFAYALCEKLGLYFKYTYSKMKDISEFGEKHLVIERSHHNFFAESRYRLTDESEFILQYGAGGFIPFGVSTYSPFGGSLATLDTQHIIRAYYRRRF